MHSGFKLYGGIDANSQKIENLPSPSADNDAARRIYVDSFFKSHVRAIMSTNQTIPTAVATKVQFSTETYDGLGEYDPVTNFRFTASVAGYYSVYARVFYANLAWLAGQGISLYLYKNGVHISVIGRHTVEANFTSYMESKGSDCIYLAVNDYVEIFTEQARGADSDIYGSAYHNILCISRIA